MTTFRTGKKAGSPIDYAIAQRIFGPDGKGRRVIQGHVDPRTRIFQSGGPMSKLVYWKRRVIPVSVEAWEAVELSCAERIEFIDHDHNEVYTCQVEDARKHGIRFDDGMGKRYGIPLDCFTVFDSEGNVVIKGPGRS